MKFFEICYNLEFLLILYKKLTLNIQTFCIAFTCRAIGTYFPALKGKVWQDFLCQVFFKNHLPQAPENNIGVILIFSKIRRDNCKWRCTTSINNTGGKFATGINHTGGKFCHRYRWCCWYQWKIFNRCQRYKRQIFRRCQRHQWQIVAGITWWQIMGTVSGCWHVKVNLKEKIYLYVYSTTQRCFKK